MVAISSFINYHWRNQLSNISTANYCELLLAAFSFVLNFCPHLAMTLEGWESRGITDLFLLYNGPGKFITPCTFSVSSRAINWFLVAFIQTWACSCSYHHGEGTTACACHCMKRCHQPSVTFLFAFRRPFWFSTMPLYSVLPYLCLAASVWCSVRCSFSLYLGMV